MKVNELREKSDKELREMLDNLKKERIASEPKARQPGESSKRYVGAKRLIAKIKTILHERELNKEQEQ